MDYETEEKQLQESEHILTDKEFKQKQNAIKRSAKARSTQFTNEPVKKNLDILPTTWKEDILAIYREGGIDVNVRLYIKENVGSFSKNLWNRWLAEEDEFYNVISHGQDLSLAYWLKLGMDNIGKRDFSVNMWKHILNNVFGWKEGNSIEVVERKVGSANYTEMNEKELMSAINKKMTEFSNDAN